MEQTAVISEPKSAQVVQEYVIKIPKERTKRFNVMRFNRSLNIDVSKWRQVKMERENNYKEFKLDDEGPKYGAGSEFGREQRDEARRKKCGIITKQYNPENQPWILKLNGKTSKKFKGVREGGVTENASFYVFTQAANGTFEAFPVEEWYNFTPIQCYKTLSPEEAEEAYCRREKVFNYFSIMTQKRMRADAGDDEDGEEKAQGGSTKKKKQPKDFKLTDLDEFGLMDSDESESEAEEEEKPAKKKKPIKKKGKKKKKEDENSDDEALEESDEGDFDDKEVDYITSSSGSEEEVGEDEKTNRDLKGVEDEEALRKLMSEEEEEEEENAEENKEGGENGETKEKVAEAKPKQKVKKSDSSDNTSESSDSDFDDPKFTSAIFVPKSKSKKKNGSDNSGASSRANTPTKLLGEKSGQRDLKRKFGESSSPPPAKQQKLDNQSGHASALDGINEESIRRYLKRKPMTAVELLHKFKSKKTKKVDSGQLVQKIADVLKKMDLQKSNIKGKMYLSLKSA